jgi:hypothetical protein
VAVKWATHALRHCFSTGSPSCTAKACDTIDFGDQRNLALDTVQALGTSQNNAYATVGSASQSALNNAVGGTFACASGFEASFSGLEFVCSTADGGARFNRQICNAISCENGANPGTPWCAFVTMNQNINRTNVSVAALQLPDCRLEAQASHVWCRCVKSQPTFLNEANVVKFTPEEMITYSGWLGDTNCDQVFDTELCHADAGKCTGFTYPCEEQLTSNIVPACCSSADCR